MKKITFLFIMASIMMMSCQSTQEAVVSETYVSASPPDIQEEAEREPSADEQAIASQYEPNSGRLIARMEMSDEQVGTYKSILEKYNKEVSTVRKKYQGNEKATMDRIRQLQASQDAEIRSMLNESQYGVYIQAMEQHRSK